VSKNTRTNENRKILIEEWSEALGNKFGIDSVLILPVLSIFRMGQMVQSQHIT